MADMDSDSVGSEVPLLENIVDIDASELEKKHFQAINVTIKSTDTAIQNFKQFKTEIKVSYIKSRKVRISGLMMTIFGSLFAIVGFCLGFVTFEASIAIISFGTLLSAVGAIVIGGSEVWYMTVIRSVRRNVKIIRKVTTNKLKELETIEDQFCRFSSPPTKVLSILVKEPQVSIKIERHSCKPQSKPMARTVFCSCKVFDGVSDVILTIILAITRATAGGGVQISVRTLWKELGIVMRMIGIGVTILDFVFIPIDICVLIKSVYDIHKYNGSNSCAAKEINDLIEKFQRQKRDLERCQSDSTFNIDSACA